MPVNITRMFGNSTAWDHDSSPMFFQPTDEFVTVISLVCNHKFASQIKRFQQFLRITNVITVPWRQHKPQWVSQPIYHCMDLRTQSSPAASEGLFAPFFAPLPCWWTLTVVLSNIRVLSSTISWAINSSKTCSHTPCRLHRRNRVIHSSKGHTAPADPARVSLYSANTRFH